MMGDDVLVCMSPKLFSLNQHVNSRGLEQI